MKRKLYFIIPLVIILFLIIFFIFKLLTGALSIINGAFNTVLGILVLLLLLGIVIFMFLYARKKH